MLTELRVADNPGEAYDARSLREAGVDFQQRGLEGFVMLLKGEGFRPFVAPIPLHPWAVKSASAEESCDPCRLPGGCASRRGHVVDIKAVFAAEPHWAWMVESPAMAASWG